MLALEGDVAAQALEEAAQHEPDRLGIFRSFAMTDRQQGLRDLAGKAFVLDMLGAKSGDGRETGLGHGQSRFVGGEDNRLLISMNIARQWND